MHWSWLILAAAEDYDDPAIDAADAVADSFGFHTGATDCDHGASEALGVPEGVAVSVYFESEADAQAALLAFQARGVDGAVALVPTCCLDSGPRLSNCSISVEMSTRFGWSGWSQPRRTFSPLRHAARSIRRLGRLACGMHSLRHHYASMLLDGGRVAPGPAGVA